MALCSLVLVLAVAVAGLTAVTASVRCTDAARELARLAARGEPDRGREVAAALAPGGARVELTRTGDAVTAEVSVEPARPLPLRVGARAVAVLEPGVLQPGVLQPGVLGPTGAEPTGSAPGDDPRGDQPDRAGTGGTRPGPATPSGTTRSGPTPTETTPTASKPSEISAIACSPRESGPGESRPSGAVP